MPVDIKGYVLKGMVSEVKASKGDAGIAQLGALYGDIGFNGNKIYSEEECIKLLKSVSEVLYGGTDEKQLEKTGRLLANVHRKGGIAAIVEKLLSTGALKGLFLSKQFLSITDSSMHMVSPSIKTKLENPDPYTVIVTFYDTKMPPVIFEGEWDELFKYLCGDNLSTTFKVISQTEFQIRIHSINMGNIQNTIKKIKV